MSFHDLPRPSSFAESDAAQIRDAAIASNVSIQGLYEPRAPYCPIILVSVGSCGNGQHGFIKLRMLMMAGDLQSGQSSVG